MENLKLQIIDFSRWAKNSNLESDSKFEISKCNPLPSLDVDYDFGFVEMCPWNVFYMWFQNFLGEKRGAKALFYVVVNR